MNNHPDTNIKGKNILVCPLNWGLGHASRMIKLIEIFLENRANITIGADGEALDYLKEEYPQIPIIKIPGYRIQYAKTGILLVLHFIWQSPKILYATIYEHYLLKRILKNRNFDLIISDNRYGLWLHNTKSVFITHQLFIRLPLAIRFLKFIPNGFVHFCIRKYTECWVPDNKGGNNLSGRLAHGRNLPDNIRYIGPLSRFHYSLPTHEFKYKFCCIISGPEQQRSLFEQKMYLQLNTLSFKNALVRGVNDSSLRNENKQLDIFGRLNTRELFRIIEQSEIVICRSGYSSIMDLIRLNKRAVLVPTPGQPEQEYLADYLEERKAFMRMKQKNIDISKIVLSISRYSPDKMIEENSTLEAIQNVLKDA